MKPLTSLVDRLSAISQQRQVPLDSALEWPANLDENAWCFSPELISLFGTATYEGMGDAQRKRLSVLEATNFFSINVHGEKALVEGLARRIHSAGCESISPYLHHFVDEENKHMFYFAKFCRRYVGKIYPERKFAVPRTYASGEEDFLFFAKILIFEWVVDAYNLRMAADTRLLPVVRAINRLHHLDEARHLVFGRSLVKELFERHARYWSENTCTDVRHYLADYLASMRGDYANPDVYRDAGLSDPLALREEALRDPKRLALWHDITATCRNYLIKNGMLGEEHGL